MRFEIITAGIKQDALAHQGRRVLAGFCTVRPIAELDDAGVAPGIAL